MGLKTYKFKSALLIVEKTGDRNFVTLQKEDFAIMSDCRVKDTYAMLRSMKQKLRAFDKEFK